MSEWKNKYNPFNSWKALTHAQHFEAILDGKPKPPIVVNFDLTNQCNYGCRFCMFGGAERADPSGSKFRFNNAELPRGYAVTLPKIWEDWGVKAECLAGGGEPTLHQDCLDHILAVADTKINLGIATNGYLMNSPKWWEAVQNCKFVGFSIDAGNEEDYAATKRVPPEAFHQVIRNIEGIASIKRMTNSKVQLGYKFLLDEMNWTSIYSAAKIASQIGINHFQFRPAINPNYEFFAQRADQIWEQIEKAQELNRPDFEVIGVRHKFNPDFSKKHQFEKCRATMLTTTWAADGWVYMCTDTRGNEWSQLVRHYPDPWRVIEYWGSPEHFEKVGKIDFHNKCDRCTLTAYNEFFENIFINDKMDRNLI